jgi:hypothetical protein
MMKKSYLVCNTSDFHLENSANVVLEFISENFPHIDEFVLVGDRSVDPNFSETNGENLLRKSKLMAKEQGKNYVEAENIEWRGKYKQVLIKQWLGVLEPTRRMHKLIEGYVNSGKIPQILDLGGNDWDKEKRIRKAYELLPPKKSKGETLFDILDNSHAFRKLINIEFKVIGKTLEINIPYIEERTDNELRAYTLEIKSILDKCGGGVTQIVFRSHSNSDPKLRLEKRNCWYIPIFNYAKKVSPNSKILHIFGHCHKLLKPYKYNGVLLVSVGYGKKEGLQRVFIQDYLNPENDVIKDLKIKY